MGKPFYYNVEIQEAQIPDNYSNIYVEYSVKTDLVTSETFKTETVITFLFRLFKRQEIPYGTIVSFTNSKKSMMLF